MAAHFSSLAWRIPWTGEPGRLQSMGCKESDMTKCLNTQHMTAGLGAADGSLENHKPLPEGLIALREKA